MASNADGAGVEVVGVDGTNCTGALPDLESEAMLISFLVDESSGFVLVSANDSSESVGAGQTLGV